MSTEFQNELDFVDDTFEKDEISDTRKFLLKIDQFIF